MSQTIHFFTRGGTEVASSRYRAMMIADELSERYSLNTKCHTPIDSSPAAIKTFSGLRAESRELYHTWRQSHEIGENDVLYFQRPVNKRLRGMFLLSQKANPTIFDFDDAIFLQRPALTRWFIQNADAVAAGNEFLQRYAESYSESVHLVPTGVQFDQYNENAPSTDSVGSTFRIGWAGNIDAHRENLEQLESVLRSYGSSASDSEVVLIGTKNDSQLKQRFSSIDGIQSEFVDWIPAQEYSTEVPKIISTFDVGVMPLKDTFWNRGKSGLKLIEYMACGIPAIASPVGENENIIQPGYNGYLAEDGEEWIEAFSTVRNHDEMQTLKRNARNTVADNYTISKSAEKVNHIIQNV